MLTKIPEFSFCVSEVVDSIDQSAIRMTHSAVSRAMVMEAANIVSRLPKYDVHSEGDVLSRTLLNRQAQLSVRDHISECRAVGELEAASRDKISNEEFFVRRQWFELVSHFSAAVLRWSRLPQREGVSPIAQEIEILKLIRAQNESNQFAEADL